jgi:hypothetical protein
MDGEYWVSWFDIWGSGNGHAGYNNGASTLQWILSQGDHFSIYMFHGGTSWGFGNGASSQLSPVQPFTTSYDYAAPLDETGRPSSLYNGFRSTISQYVSNVPAVPSTPPIQSIAQFALTPVAGWFDSLPTPHTASSPVVMEALGQVFGYILYEHVATGSNSGSVSPGDKARDRVIVYVNGVRQGVIDSIYSPPNTVNVNLQSGDYLWLLVENLGRADNGFSDQTKGIKGSVTVGGATLTNWNMYTLPLDSAPSGLPTTAKTVSTACSPPVWYSGTFTNTQTPGMAADTLLSLPGGVKGVVFVNGHILGRYWTVGPQQQLYVPGAWLNQGSNQVLVLELEPTTSSRVALGLSSRSWSNNADPDHGSNPPSCSIPRPWKPSSTSYSATSTPTTTTSSHTSTSPTSSPTATTSTTKSTTSTTTTTSSSNGACQTLYGQCGGIGWAGPTCCSSSTCQVGNPYYSQCLT